MDRPLKILLLGDASNYHRALSLGLRERGHYVSVASSGSEWQDTTRDIDIKRRYAGKIGGLELWLRLNALVSTRMSGYDIVSVANHGFTQLRPNRMLQVFNRIANNNKNIFLTALGADPYYVQTCTNADSPLKYSEWMIGTEPSPFFKQNPGLPAQWTAPEITKLYTTIYCTVRGAVTALYEYDEVCRKVLPADKVGYGGIPIVTKDIAVHPIPENVEKVRLFVGRHAERQVEKGTDRLYDAAKHVHELYPDKCELVLVENVPYAQYLDLLDSAHVVLDQLYSYTPATNALLAMAKGKVVVSGAEPEYYDFISEDKLRPIVNAVPDDDEALFRSIEELVLNPRHLHKRGLESREFVEKHNDASVVADRFLDFWQKKMA